MRVSEERGEKKGYSLSSTWTGLRGNEERMQRKRKTGRKKLLRNRVLAIESLLVIDMAKAKTKMCLRHCFNGTL